LSPMSTTLRRHRRRRSGSRRRRPELPRAFVDMAAFAVKLLEEHWPADAPRAVAWPLALHRIGMALGREYAESRVRAASEERIEKGLMAALELAEGASLDEIKVIADIVVSARRAELRAAALQLEVARMVFQLGLPALQHDIATHMHDGESRSVHSAERKSCAGQPLREAIRQIESCSSTGSNHGNGFL